jgi:hypothetical protein
MPNEHCSCRLLKKHFCGISTGVTVRKALSLAARTTMVLMITAMLSSNLWPQVRLQESHEPLFYRVTTHDPSFKKFPRRSFYESGRDWRRIIDSTWGPGLPYASKLQLFDTYASNVQNKFDGLAALPWDSLKAIYRAKITDSTSRGGFAAIMGHFSMALGDIHTYARDTVVLNTPLNPGTPILVLSSWVNVEHFGAVLTALPDSTLLVVRTVPNHPLGLRPGDIVLGYEGRPWKELVRELLDAELPVIVYSADARSAFEDGLLIGAGMDWHLFDTIDVWQASSGQTLHLPVDPLITLPSDPMVNNEQLPIPGIPFPDYFHNQSVSYGIVPNTNIGYIYLFEENFTVTDNQFHQAYMALQGTDGLIIDMRLNYGGWSFFPATFAMMFNEPILTIEDANRCSPSTVTLCPAGNSVTFKNPGQPPGQWEKPIAVLLGPTCGSDGEITAQRLRYHDMLRFFGKSSIGGVGDNIHINGFPGWNLRFSIGDMFHVSTPEAYLNRKEFPIDDSVWFSSAGVVGGHDAVVDEALGWIQHVVYAHDVTTDRHWYQPGVDSLRLAARVENPDSHQISVRAYIKPLSGSVLDSIDLTPSGEEWKGTWLVPDLEEDFQLQITTRDTAAGTSISLRNAWRVTTKGPVVLDHVLLSRSPVFPDVYSIVPSFRNAGSSRVLNLTASLQSPDSCIIEMAPAAYSILSIDAGEVNSSGYLEVRVDTTKFPGFINLNWKVTEGGWPAWEDSARATVTGVELAGNVPTRFALEQNYPNPFNPVTDIGFEIADFRLVRLSVYDLLGREVALLLNEKKRPGRYKVEFDARNLASGVYFYRLNAGDFVAVKKMVVLR